jgi:predicted nuclease with TOPRIM domain
VVGEEGGIEMSGTPISDSTPHNVAELGMLCRRLERLAAVRLAYITQLETENDAANAEIERLTNKVAQLYEGCEKQNQRINRLEEALDEVYHSGRVGASLLAKKAWLKAKEEKL